MKKLLLILFLIPFFSFAGDIYDRPRTECGDIDSDEFDWDFYTSRNEECKKLVKGLSYQVKGGAQRLCLDIKYDADKCLDINADEWLQAYWKEAEKKNAKRIEAFRKKQRDDDCLNKSAKALNDFAAKKIYKNCMDEWEDYVNNKENY